MMMVLLAMALAMGLGLARAEASAFTLEGIVTEMREDGAFLLNTADFGDVLVKVSRLDGTAAAYVPSMDMDGERIFLNLLIQGVGPEEAAVDDYIRRAKARDSDLWIVEIEDQEGRHFLTERVED